MENVMTQWATLQLPGQNSIPFFSFIVVFRLLLFGLNFFLLIFVLERRLQEQMAGTWG